MTGVVDRHLHLHAPRHARPPARPARRAARHLRHRHPRLIVYFLAWAVLLLILALAV